MAPIFEDGNSKKDRPREGDLFETRSPGTNSTGQYYYTVIYYILDKLEILMSIIIIITRCLAHILATGDCDAAVVQPFPSPHQPDGIWRLENP